MTNSADPDQSKPTVCKGRVYPGSAGQGLKVDPKCVLFRQKCIDYMYIEKNDGLSFRSLQQHYKEVVPMLWCNLYICTSVVFFVFFFFFLLLPMKLTKHICFIRLLT